MMLIFSASSDSRSYEHSSRLFEPLLHWLFPGLSQAHILYLHHLLRKCCHLSEYCVLGLLLWRAIHQPLPGRSRAWRWDEAGFALAVVFFYAATDEFHQIYVPTRTPLISDVLIDTSGGALGILMLWLLRKIFCCSGESKSPVE